MKVKVTKSYHSDHTYYDAAVKEGILLYSHVMLSWSSSVEATDCPIVAQVEVSLLFWIFINPTAYHLGQYETSSPLVH